MAELRFDAMGSWAHIVVVGGPSDACDRARSRIDDLEHRWSRFRPDSEVSRLNAGTARAALVSAETAGLLARAAEARRVTGGRFDAGVLAAVIEAGYDAAFGLVAAGPGARGGFDPGGIAKGYAADLVVEELLEAGATGACVNLGGDLRAEGVPPGGPPWVIDVEDPFGGPPVVQVGIGRGAVATSSRARRAWTVDGEQRHHVIDPATRRPAETDALAFTVLAGSGWWAEALATAALVAGVDDGLALIASSGAAALAIDERGMVHHGAGLAPYLAA